MLRLQRLIGLCAATAVLFSACSGSPPIAPESESGAQEATTEAPKSSAGSESDSGPAVEADDDVAATPAAAAEAAQAARRFFGLESDATWRDVFDRLTTPEQSCIREVLGGELREAAMAMPVFGIFAETTPRQWEVPMISCLLPESARAVFIPELILIIDRFFLHEVGFETSMEQFECMVHRIHNIGIEAAIAAFTEGDDAAAIELFFGMFTCAPEAFLLLVGVDIALQQRDLNEDERECLQKWLEVMDTAELVRLIATEDDSASALEFSFGMVACVPDLMVNSVGSELGVELLALSEDERACVRDWVASLGNDDWEAIATEDDTRAITRFGIDMIICLPSLLPTAVSEMVGLELEDLSEGERSCLQDWLKGLDDEDLARLVAGGDEARDLELSLGMFACLPDVLLFFSAAERGTEFPALSKEERTCLRDWIRNLDADLLAQITENDTEAVTGLSLLGLLGLVTCLPGVFVSGFAAGIGVEPPVVTEGEKACLQDWAEGLGVEALMLMMFPESDLDAAWQLSLEMLICLPDLLSPDFAVDRIDKSV